MSAREPALLCVGDIHLGRRPTRVPAEVEQQHGVRLEELSPRGAWRAAVREALARRVAAVLLLGDVVDSEDHYLEAFGALESGVRELVAAGIQVVAVAGNHDVRALPRLADQIAEFRLLGRGGVWEELVVEHEGRPLVRLVGWSFPRAKVSHSPVGELRLAARDDVPTVGLLHCDLDQRRSEHAPVARSELEQTPLHAWLLGHVHKPSLGGDRPIGYLGSLQGLDPSERGVHGPWLLRVRGPRAVAVEQLALAPLRWEQLELDVGALETAADLQPAIARLMRDFDATAKDELEHAAAVGLRVRLVGRSKVHRELAAEARDWDPGSQCTQIGARAWFVEALQNQARPAFDLEGLARAQDPPGLLARQLLVLAGDAESAERALLLRDARPRLEQLGDQRPWSALGPLTLDDEGVAALLERAAWQALEELLAQREEAS